jgi:hypothetical protein
VPGPVHYLPIATTVVAFSFASVVFRRYRERSGRHLLWWSIGITLYGIGTLTEASVTLFGWRESFFRAWYVAGALLGAAPLAQGTVYLLLPRRTADRLAVALLSYVAIAATFVLLTPIDTTVVEPHRLSGAVMKWQWVRLFSPIINLYAFVFLVGGAIYSALRFRGQPFLRHRAVGNGFIAVGALLPGIGGTATRMGHVEVLYVTELIGIALIWIGYRFNVRPNAEDTPLEKVRSEFTR